MRRPRRERRDDNSCRCSAASPGDRPVEEEVSDPVAPTPESGLDQIDARHIFGTLLRTYGSDVSWTSTPHSPPSISEFNPKLPSGIPNFLLSRCPGRS